MRYLPLLREVEGSEDLVLDGVCVVHDHDYDTAKEYVSVVRLDGCVEMMPVEFIGDLNVYAVRCIALERSIRESVIQ